MITCSITCKSLEELNKIKNYINLAKNPDKIYTDIAVAWPDGKKQVICKHHKVGDYFKEITVTKNANILDISFLPLKPRGHWKDIMFEILKIAKGNQLVFSHSNKDDGSIIP